MPEMTPLRNNPPQSQPMRQAYDYWQEVHLAQTQETEESKLFCWKSQERICKAPCAWRVPPPPAGAVPRYYPYAKVISSARSDLRAACTPPHAGRFPLLPVCKSYQQCARPTAGPSSEVLGYIYLLIKGCPRTTPSGWTAGHSLLVLLQSWHMPAAR